MRGGTQVVRQCKCGLVSSYLAPYLTQQVHSYDFGYFVSQILHVAAAALRAGVGGAAVVVSQWTAYSSVCKT